MGRKMRMDFEKGSTEGGWTRASWRTGIGLLALLLVAACGNGGEPHKQGEQTTASSAETSAGGEAIPTGQLARINHPTGYVLDLTIDPRAERFSGTVAIDLAFGRPAKVIWLHGRNLDVKDVRLEQGGRTIAGHYQEVHPTGVAKITLDEMPAKGAGRLVIRYSAPFNGALEGLYKVVDGGEAYAFTQFEATSARLAFPGFDEPFFKVPFAITVKARKGDKVITNTPETAREDAGDGWVLHRFARTKPLPTYLIAFAVGPLDVVEGPAIPPNAVRDRPIPLRGVATRGKGKRLAYALANTGRIVEVEEKYFGIAYPYAKLDIIAVPDFAAGAMENVGAITFREELLLLDETTPVQRKRAFKSVTAHELAHQWFGDLVTPKWWDDIWLNESFATWMGNKATALAFPGEGFENATFRGALRVMGADALATARQIRQPIESNHDIATAFDGITYQKGGAVLAMFEAWLGEENFRHGVQTHLKRFAHSVADVYDFLDSLNEGSGRPEVKEAFKTFLFQPGVPLVSARTDCSDPSTPRVALAQRRYLPLGSRAPRTGLWQIPVCIAFGSDQGRTRLCTLFGEPEASIDLPAKSCPAWMIPNAQGSGYYRFALDAEGWQRLFAHLAALDGREQQAMMGSLSAAYRSGDLATATLADAFRRMVASDDREVITGPMADLGTIRDHLLEGETAKAGFRDFVRALYGPHAARLGIAAKRGEKLDDRLLRPSVIGIMATTVKDADLRRQLAAAAADFVEGGRPDPTRLDPGLIGLALRVAVADGDGDFAERLLDKALASRDAFFRQMALAALAASPDPALGEKMRALILDPRLRDNEATLVAFVQSGRDEQRAAIWAWVQDHLDAFVQRIPTWRQGAVTNVAAGFCSKARADEVKAFFADKVAHLEGGPRELAQTIERIELCAALAQAKRAEASGYFAARP
ncbi:MAG: M1 family peptidase [Alphaproteobacteria bacterium]|nr:MAG: M1 family peptidase [Alphaproteobacteria bacterium]